MEPDAEMVDESTDGEDGWFRRDALQSSKSAAE
jgi:hypothetical protein